MNFWKQTTHVMSYFKGENIRGEKRPSSFMAGFLEVGHAPHATRDASLSQVGRVGTDDGSRTWACVYKPSILQPSQNKTSNAVVTVVALTQFKSVAPGRVAIESRSGARH